MNQRIVEVIVYLLEMTTSPTVDQAESLADQAAIKQRLEEAGFAKDIVSSAFDWLKELIEQQCWYASNSCLASKTIPEQTLRIYNLEETTKINVEVRNFILTLEYAGILDTNLREIVISQMMHLNQPAIDLIDAKWVVLLVIMSKSNKNINDIRSYLLSTMALEE